MPIEYLLVIVAFIVHFGFAAVAVAIARAQGRKDLFFWTIAALILGPIALVILYAWRGDPGARGESKPPVADPEKDPQHQHRSGRSGKGDPRPPQ